MESLKEICPALGGLNIGGAASVWGPYEAISYGWSKNPKIRQAASSGGVLTSICLFLLKNKKVDGIIQTVGSKEKPYATSTIISRTEDEVLACMGSRYSISSPLQDIFRLMKQGERYAFVGKPCDVSALRAFMNQNSQFKQSIVYLFSFFCAGMPSVDAQKKLLRVLEVKEEECKSLQYRGNGWPGYATAKDLQEREHKISYDESWGKILGRDVRTCCRFCFDGIGLAADIACGDAWYLKADKAPDFSEKEGRNVIFARTDKGNDLLKKCIDEGILANESAEVDDLRYMQKYQFERRSTMLAQTIGLRMAGRPTPNYSYHDMLALSRHVGIKKQLSRLKGIVVRCKNGKI